MLADGYTQATVAAHLGGGGRARTLRYAVGHTGHGQTVRFIERGAFGTHLLGRATAARGTLRFSPADARGGRRTVLALIAHDGIVVHRVKLATYVAPGPRPPGRVAGARARRAGRGLTLSWGSSSGAAQYVVHVKGSHGTRRPYVLPGRTHHLTVAAAATGDRLSATVAGRSRSGRTGPATSLR